MIIRTLYEWFVVTTLPLNSYDRHLFMESMHCSTKRGMQGIESSLWEQRAINWVSRIHCLCHCIGSEGACGRLSRGGGHLSYLCTPMCIRPIYLWIFFASLWFVRSQEIRLIFYFLWSDNRSYANFYFLWSDNRSYAQLYINYDMINVGIHNVCSQEVWNFFSDCTIMSFPKFSITLFH